ncbi:glycosyltransferase family 39 protein [Micromonospora sonneratiae]
MPDRSDPSTQADQPLSPVAWIPLAVAAGLTGTVLLAFSGRYGYHRDELYYLVAGRHLAWGYDDQPPLLPALARLTDSLSGGSLTALRLPTAVVVGVTVLLVGLLTRELGGGRWAQLLAAVGWATTGVAMVSGHLLSTTPYDVLCWTTTAWLLARWVRTRDDRMLLALGPVLGVGLLAKSLPLLFVAALAIAVLISGPREILRRPALWIAAGIAVALWAPNLWWQATHGWPQLTMTGVIRADADFGGRLGLLPSQVLIMGPPLAVIWIAGLWRLLRNPDARRYRFLGWAYLVVLALTLLTGGREYYPAGAYPVLFASGAIATIGWLSRGARGRRAALGVGLVLNGLSTVTIALPIYPVRTLPHTPQAMINYDAGETVGWPELVSTVARVHRSLPASEQATAVILTRNYGQAGAIDRYGRPLGLPTPYSGHLNFWRWGPPADSATGPVIVIGRWPAEELSRLCGTVVQVASNDNGYGVENEEQGAPIWLCRDLDRPWSQVWPELRRFG